AAELGLDTAEFESRLQRSRFLTRRLGQALGGGLVRREVFEDNFFNLAQTLGIGDARFGRSGIYSAEGEFADEAPPEDPEAPIEPENYQYAPEESLPPKPGPAGG